MRNCEIEKRSLSKSDVDWVTDPERERLNDRDRGRMRNLSEINRDRVSGQLRINHSVV